MEYLELESPQATVRRWHADDSTGLWNVIFDSQNLFHDTHANQLAAASMETTPMIQFTIAQHHDYAARQFEEAARHHRLAARHAQQNSHEFANMHAHSAATHQATASEHALLAASQFDALHE